MVIRSINIGNSNAKSTYDVDDYEDDGVTPYIILSILWPIVDSVLVLFILYKVLSIINKRFKNENRSSNSKTN
jgi:hypothetical protein